MYTFEESISNIKSKRLTGKYCQQKNINTLQTERSKLFKYIFVAVINEMYAAKSKVYDNHVLKVACVWNNINKLYFASRYILDKYDI